MTSTMRYLLFTLICVVSLGVGYGQCPGPSPACKCEGLKIDCKSTKVCPKDVPPATEELTLQDGNCGVTVDMADFQHLVNLKKLVIRIHPYRIADNSAFSKTKLTHLTITQTTIQTLLSGSLDGLPYLSDLILSNNEFSVLPGNIFQGLRSIIRITLSGNRLSFLSHDLFIGLSNITSLDLSNNSIETFSSDTFTPLTSLTSLRLDSNKLLTLPAGFLSGVPVKSLGIHLNRLETIHPDAFVGSAIVSFKMDQNNFNQFPTAAFQKLNRPIAALVLTKNHIDKLSAHDVTNLQIDNLLDLSFNPLSVIEEGAFSGSKIKALNLVGTSLTRLPRSMEPMLKNTPTKLNLTNVGNWECECEALWLAEFFDSVPNTGPICNNGKLLGHSVPDIKILCELTTTTTTTSITTTTTITPEPTSTPTPPQATPRPVLPTNGDITSASATLNVLTPQPGISAATNSPNQQMTYVSPGAHPTMGANQIPQATGQPNAQSLAKPNNADDSDPNSLLNIGLIIATALGLATAICSVLLATYVIRTHKATVLRLLRIEPYPLKDGRGPDYPFSEEKKKPLNDKEFDQNFNNNTSSAPLKTEC